MSVEPQAAATLSAYELPLTVDGDGRADILLSVAPAVSWTYA